MTMILPAGPVAGQKTVVPVITLSGEVIIDIGGGARLYRAELRIQTDGTMDKREDSTIAQIDNATDWVIPNGVAPGTWQFRYVNRTGFVPNGSTNMTEDVWVAISGGILIIGIQQSLAAATNESTNFDLEVREGTGSLIDTAAYNLQIDRII